MPYAPRDAKEFNTWVEGLSYRRKRDAVLNFPGLYDLVRALPPQHGAGSTYPAGVHLLVGVLTRIYGSQRRALIELSDEGVWGCIGEQYARMSKRDTPIASRPPTSRQQERFLKWLTDDAKVAAARQERGVLSDLEEWFTRSAVVMARRLGHFPSGVQPDWAHPSLANTIVGDGTWVQALSGVELVEDPITGGLLPVGSRAIQRPRVQTVTTWDAEDDETTAKAMTVKGINQVSASAWTEYGWVVLAVGQARRAEMLTAMKVIERVKSAAGDDLHTVIWDRAITGWPAEALMANHRILVINKGVARAKNSRAHRILDLTESDAVERYETDQPVPLGTTVLNKPDRGQRMFRTRYSHYGQRQASAALTTSGSTTDRSSMSG